MYDLKALLISDQALRHGEALTGHVDGMKRTRTCQTIYGYGPRF